MIYHDFTSHEMQGILLAIERACLICNIDQDSELGLAVRTHVTELAMECAEGTGHDPEQTLECAIRAFENTWSKGDQMTLIT